MLKKEYEILLPMIRQPWRRISLRQVKEECSKTSEGYVYNSLQKFCKANIIVPTRVGNQVLYSLNLKSNKCLSYISGIAEYHAWNKPQIPYSIIEELLGKIIYPSYSFIITGSYAINTQRQSSDIDLVILIENNKKKKVLASELHYASELSFPKAHIYIFTYDEFYSMLVNDSVNYGKEISSKSLILRGASTYYSIIFKAVRNGFNSHKLFGEGEK
jgi:predicted nucleotidyltransferase